MKRSLVVLACLLAPAGAAVAETLVMNDQVQVAPSDVQRPHRGATMKAVEQQFGTPLRVALAALPAARRLRASAS
jgi:hypothetical protein